MIEIPLVSPDPIAALPTVVWHGTSRARAAAILDTGQLAPRHENVSVWVGGTDPRDAVAPSVPTLVYATRWPDIARYAAFQAAIAHRDEAAVVAVTPDWDRAVLDEDLVIALLRAPALRARLGAAEGAAFARAALRSVGVVRPRRDADDPLPVEACVRAAPTLAGMLRPGVTCRILTALGARTFAFRGSLPVDRSQSADLPRDLADLGVPPRGTNRAHGPRGR